MLLPTAFTATRLFATGAILGPLIDGLHNQALLQYDVLPIALHFTDSLSLQTSAVVPPLLGITYIVLGSVMPNALDELFQKFPFPSATSARKSSPTTTASSSSSSSSVSDNNNKNRNDFDHDQRKVQFVWLTLRAIAAVLSTAAIVRWTEFLLNGAASPAISNLINPSAFSSAGTIESYLLLLITVCIVQWAWLDGTMTTLLVASMAAVAGPLAELPFLSLGWWEYFKSPALFYPLGEASSLGIHSLTGPCYFAVTMDAIALGRWFAAMETLQQADDDRAEFLVEENDKPLQAINGAFYNPEDLVVKEQPVMMALGDEPENTTEHANKR